MEFVASLAGTVVGGVIVLFGQWLEARRTRMQHRTDRVEAAVVTLQDDVVELTRAAVEASEKLGTSSWQPTRYAGARLRVLGVTSRVGDPELESKVAGLLEVTDRVAHESAPRSDIDSPAEEVARQAVKVFRTLPA
jgi:hypothetical protein